MFVLSFVNETGSREHTGYYYPTVQIKGHDIMTESHNIFNQLVKNNLRMYENIKKIATGKGNTIQLNDIRFGILQGKLQDDCS